MQWGTLTCLKKRHYEVMGAAFVFRMALAALIAVSALAGTVTMSILAAAGISKAKATGP